MAPARIRSTYKRQRSDKRLKITIDRWHALSAARGVEVPATPHALRCAQGVLPLFSLLLACRQKPHSLRGGLPADLHRRATGSPSLASRDRYKPYARPPDYRLIPPERRSMAKSDRWHRDRRHPNAISLSVAKKSAASSSRPTRDSAEVASLCYAYVISTKKTHRFFPLPQA
jgi:hypothetical protein